MVIDRATLARTAAAFAAGRGPVAVDAERASGFRYSQRAYLVQLRRAGAGTALVDPIPLHGDLGELAPVLSGPEWVLHAANQDLPCLAEVGLAPARLFDTELAGRLAGLPRVGLGPLVEQLLGLRLEKGHGAADWSRRPLPEDWLVYAALDVEVLVQLRDVLPSCSPSRASWTGRSRSSRRCVPPGRHRRGPSRGGAPPAFTRSANPASWPSCVHCGPLGTGSPRERDMAPGRVLPDSAIVDAAVTNPDSASALAAMPVFRGRAQRRLTSYWFAAVAEAAGLDPAQLPLSTAPAEGPPPVARWADRDPDAAARLTAARAGVAAVALERSVPVENLLQPELLRRLCWSPPDDGDLAGALRKGAAREWQIALLTPVLQDAFARAAD